MNIIKKIQKLFLLFGLAIVILCVVFAPIITPKAHAAADATIAISPTSLSAVVGDDFSVDVTINPLDHYVTNADLYITYDQTKFTLTSITASATFNVPLGQSVPATPDGTASYSASTAFGSHIDSTTTYATLNFHAVETTTGSSPITITGATMVYADNSPTYPSDAGTNVVGTRTRGAVTINASDTTPPTGGSIAYTDGYITMVSVSLTAADGTDAVSGINTSSRIVQRRSATLSDGACGTYGSFSTISQTGTYPNFTDTTVSSGNCYQYQYLVSDNASSPNQATYTSTNVIKVDTAAPTGGSVSYTDGFNRTQTIIIAVNDGTDAISGINTSGRIIQRKSATPTAGVCGLFGSWSTMTPSGTYPNFADTTMAEDTCYQYQFLISDTAGNQATYTSTQVMKSSYRSDINNNGSVLGDDFSILHTNYNLSTAQPDNAADIDGDNYVNGADFSILHTEYGSTF